MNQDEHDNAYTEGSRRAWLTILAEALHNLGYDGPEHSAHRWILEREETVLALRSICEDFGDNDWDETLHLADVLNKHLARQLHEDRDLKPDSRGDAFERDLKAD